MKSGFMVSSLALAILALPSAADDLTPADKTTAMLKAAVAAETVPGVSLAIADRQGIIWAGAEGYADIENQVPLTPTHKMRIGSVAKVMAAAGLMRLHDQGKVDLHAPVRTYVPAWPAKHAPFTLAHLTSHSSGIRHYRGAEFMNNQTYDSVSDGLAIFADDDLLFQPGSGTSYSTYAWSLVSAAMEGADGNRDFQAIMKEEVFGPLQMSHTAFDDQYKIISHRPRPYTVREGKLVNAPQTDHSYKWAGGGFIASPSDISRFAVAHIEPGYLGAEALDMMFTKATLSGGRLSQYGIGWQLEDTTMKTMAANDPDFGRILADHPDIAGHSGGSMGGVTMMILCRTHGRAVTVVKNVSGEATADMRGLALKALDIFYWGSAISK